MSMGSKMFKVIAPIEKKDGGTFWMRVGSAFPNKDGSTNLYMDAWPVGTKTLQLREMTEEDFARKRPHGESAPVPAPQDLPF
jgi:hypothetical protein